VTYGDEQAEHLDVTVAPPYSGSKPLGTVTIKANSTLVCTIKLVAGKGSDATGSCSLTPTKLPAGGYTVVATYGGSSDFNTSVSGKVSLTVLAPSKTTLTLVAPKVTYGGEQFELLARAMLPRSVDSTVVSVLVGRENADVCSALANW
jgi:hypothetical protein